MFANRPSPVTVNATSFKGNFPITDSPKKAKRIELAENLIKPRTVWKNPNVRSLDTKYLNTPATEIKEKLSLHQINAPEKKTRYQTKILSVAPSKSQAKPSDFLKKAQQYSEGNKMNFSDKSLGQAKSGEESVPDAFTFYDPDSQRFIGQKQEQEVLRIPSKKKGKISAQNQHESNYFMTESAVRHQSMKELGENLEISAGKGHDFFDSQIDVEDINTNYNRYDQHGKPLTISGINTNLIQNKSRAD